MEKEDHKRSKEQRSDKNERLDRHSASGLDPNPKKGGHGGWGVEGETGAIEVVDPKDPNYNSDEEIKEEEKAASHPKGDSSVNVIPAKYCSPPILLDENFTRTGTPIQDLLSFNLNKVPNLYSLENNTFVFLYAESDESCDKGNPVQATSECEIEETQIPRGLSITFDDTPFVELGLNYLGKIIITHPDETQ